MSSSASVPRISRLLLRLFRWIVRGYFRRGFHGVRIRGAERFAGVTGPLIVYGNHGSWWDPMVCFLLGDLLMRGRAHYAPMEEEALGRYGFLRHLGVFGVKLDSPRGAVQFLRTGEAVLRSGGVLWVTPQGRFVDVRARPLVFKPGLAALATRAAGELGQCTVLPLAIEYTFWDERTPECLLEFGDAVILHGSEGAEEVEAKLEAALTATMDSLQVCAMERDPRRFRTLRSGRVGTGGVYGVAQRLTALLLRRPFRAEHTVVEDGGAR